MSFCRANDPYILDDRAVHERTGEERVIHTSEEEFGSGIRKLHTELGGTLALIHQRRKQIVSAEDGQCRESQSHETVRREVNLFEAGGILG
jgi:hypothetical protein